MRGAAESLTLYCLTCVLSVLGPGAALAADEPSGADDAPPPQPYFSLHRLDAFMELEADYRHSRVDSGSRSLFEPGRNQTNREWGFEERIGFRLGATVLDPSFITLGGELSFALTQDHYEEYGNWFDTRRDNDSGYLLQYDLRADFFTGKKLSGSFYGLRQDDRITRRFQPTLDQRRTGFGTSWTWADDTLPMELSYDFLETDRWGNRDKRDDERFIEQTLSYGATWIIDKHDTLKFSFEHAETEQEYQGDFQQFETTRDLFTLDHELAFGDQYQHTFQTLVHWQEESGDFARDFFEIGPQLTLRHSDTLQTIYKYQFNRERYAGLDIETQRADFQLIHQIYSNLTTTVNAFALYEDIENDINTTQWGGSVDWQYNRRNPYGHFYANLALAYDTERIRGENGVRVVLDESHTFRDPVAIMLRNPDTVPYAIVVTNTCNRRVYTPGSDYLVYTQGNYTRIRRLRGGRIEDGQTILVDYQYRTPTTNQIDSFRVDFSVEQRFTGGLTPYYRFSYRNQEDRPSFGFPQRADRTDHHRIGVNYKLDRYTFSTEFEVFDDTIDPYEAFHLNGMVHLIQTRDHTLDASTRFSRYYFSGGYDYNRDVTMIDVELDHRWQIAERLSTVERVTYRLEEDSVAGTTQGWDVTIGFQYEIGDLTTELTLEYDRLDLPYSDDEDFGVYFRLRRELGSLIATR